MGTGWGYPEGIFGCGVGRPYLSLGWWQMDFGHCSSSPYKGGWLPNPSVPVAAAPQARAPYPAPPSLLGWQIEGEDATWLLSTLIPCLESA